MISYQEVYNKMTAGQLSWLADRLTDGTIKVPEQTVLPEGTVFYVVYPGCPHVTRAEYWYGYAVDAGPSQFGLRLFSDHTVENAGMANYAGLDGLRWYLRKEEAEAACSGRAAE